jgi:hypothetical protein
MIKYRATVSKTYLTFVVDHEVPCFQVGPDDDAGADAVDGSCGTCDGIGCSYALRQPVKLVRPPARHATRPRFPILNDAPAAAHFVHYLLWEMVTRPRFPVLNQCDSLPSECDSLPSECDKSTRTKPAPQEIRAVAADSAADIGKGSRGRGRQSHSAAAQSIVCGGAPMNNTKPRPTDSTAYG